MSVDGRVGLAGLIVALLGIAAFYLWPDKKWIGWLALSGAAAFILVWAWLELHPKKERPHITANLVIDSVDSNGEATFHFELENIADIGIIVSKVFFGTQSEVSAELQHPITRFLPPNKGKLRISAPPQFVLRPQFQNIDLDVIYIDSSEKSFTSWFRFFVQPADIRPQELSPEYLSEFEGTVADQESNAVMGLLIEPQGTAFLVLDEQLENGRPNVVRFHDASGWVDAQSAGRKIRVWAGVKEELDAFPLGSWRRSFQHFHAASRRKVPATGVRAEGVLRRPR
jgi:hypothetical protein